MAEYIEREALTPLAYKSGDYGHPAVVDLEDIANIPCADVAPVVHGEWIKGKYGLIYCNICGNGAEERFGEQCETPFCNNCGAKMGGNTE